MKCPFRRGLMPRDIVSSNRSLKCILTLIPCEHEEPQCLLVPALLLSLHALDTIPYDSILWIGRIRQDPSRYGVAGARAGGATGGLPRSSWCTHRSHFAMLFDQREELTANPAFQER